MDKCRRLGAGVGVAGAGAAVALAAWVASGPDAVVPPLETRASGVFADGFGFVVLGCAVLVGLGAPGLSRLGARARTAGARLGVGAACVLGGAAGLWILLVGALTPGVLHPGLMGSVWAVAFAATGAVLLGASAAGLCTTVRRGQRPRGG